MRVLAWCAIGCCLAGCDPRPPIVRAEVGSLASNLQVREGLAWGDPRDIQPPVIEHGHRWWQVSYGPERIILVDADSGWARFPWPGYVPRHPATVTSPAPSVPTLVPEGSWVLVLAPSRILGPEDMATAEREIVRLNALAGQTGLHPLFSLRTDREGRTALVYGWQGDRGMLQDPRVVGWLQLRTTYHAAQWVDLLAAEAANGRTAPAPQ